MNYLDLSLQEKHAQVLSLLLTNLAERLNGLHEDYLASRWEGDPSAMMPQVLWLNPQWWAYSGSAHEAAERCFLSIFNFH